MNLNLKIIKAIEVKHLSCQFGVRYWEDSTIDGVEDDAENPQMPCVEEDKQGKYWHLEIDPKTGLIENWPKGHKAHICYKVCDACNIDSLIDGADVVRYKGYVPEFLDTYGDGFGDYLHFDIDEDGFIEDWCKYCDTFDLTKED